MTSGSSVSAGPLGFSPSVTPAAAAISLPTPDGPTTSVGVTAVSPAGTDSASLPASCPDSGWIGFRSSRAGSSTLTVGSNASTAALLYLTPFGAFSNAAVNAVLPSSVVKFNPRTASLSLFCPYPFISKDFNTSSVITPGWAGTTSGVGVTTGAALAVAAAGATKVIGAAEIFARASSIFFSSVVLVFSRFLIANLLPFAPLAFSTSILVCRSSYSACMASISGVDAPGSTTVVGAAAAGATGTSGATATGGSSATGTSGTAGAAWAAGGSPATGGRTGRALPRFGITKSINDCTNAPVPNPYPPASAAPLIGSFSGL